MNVAFDPWIPVVTLEGRPKLASLCEVLTEGQSLADLAVRPHERVSLMRLFLCVAHAALDGPKDYDEWCEVPKRLPDAARKYLKEKEDAFELFHPTKPWLQVSSLEPAKPGDDSSYISTSKLDFALASGAQTTLFDHPGSDLSRTLDESKLVIGLLGIQNFSTCGLLGRPRWNGKPTADSAADAPCIASSMYHAFILGDSLFSSICLNICSYDEISELWGAFWGAGKAGRPVWEEMPNSMNEDKMTSTFLGRLVPVSRAIRIEKCGTKMLYGEGLRYPAFPTFPREFTASEGVAKSKAKQEHYLVGAKLNIRPWRQLDAVLNHFKSDTQLSCSLPLRHSDGVDVDVWLGALIRNPGKQDILDSQESRFHVSSTLRSEAGCRIYADGVALSAQIERTLSEAIWIYRTALDPTSESGIGSAGTSQYWTAVEKKLGLLMAHVNALGTEDVVPTSEAWHKMLRQAARDAYEAVCGQETPRQIKAFTAGWRKLTAPPKEQESQPKKKKGAKG